ncbi:hypothetical protein G7Z17_g2023 [Cylindrodendrum hubeiense]|uniref:CHAT domain-containing protein n=1 Tax=Cylindrodendrum hubeiense TaxID=595255 RepID=A0A9P5HLR5_9HYPO|nr:hypothetical protein G7Z17_g2023 [Cylindrodendrum hubeiense]
MMDQNNGNSTSTILPGIAAGDLKELIRIAEESPNTTTEAQIHRSSLFHALGVRFSKRFFELGDMADLDEAIRTLREAVNTTPQGHPDRVYHDEANQLTQEIIDALPSDDPDRAKWLSYLATSLWMSYSMTGTAIDLDAAVQAARQAVEEAPRDHPQRLMWSNTLGVQLFERYCMTGAIIHLNTAIDVTRKLLQETTDDDKEQNVWLSNLACYLETRYQRTGADADLDEAIQLARKTVTATPTDPMRRGPYIHTLTEGLQMRYNKKLELHDLEEAIQLMSDAIQTTPKAHEKMPALLNLLGDLFQSRYFAIGETDDLDMAIETFKRSVDTSEEGQPDRAGWLYSLGLGLGHRYARTKSKSDREEALSYHLTALRQTNAPIPIRIDAGISVFKFYATVHKWQDAFESAKVAVSLIPKLTPRSLQNSDKQHVLSQVMGLASCAASAALHAGQGPLAALDLLEQGRGLLATSLEDMRTDVLDLRERCPKLAERFISVRDELEIPFTRPALFTDEITESCGEAQASRRYEAGNNLDNLIVEIRQQPGFDDFLRTPSAKEIRFAAECGPIVVINTCDYGCDAILIEPHQIRHLALTGIDSNQVKDKFQAGSVGGPKALEWLWDFITRPILHALGFTRSPPDNAWPHIWWIPTGLLTRFPLHAAGYHNKNSTDTVLDRVISSYSSSIKAIIHGRRRCNSGVVQADALLVAIPDTPGQFTKLPFASKEVEMLRGLFKSMVMDTQTRIHPPVIYFLKMGKVILLLSRIS